MTSDRTTDKERCARVEETSRGESIVDRKESSGIGEWKGRRDKGMGW